jgi:hypothetical protein
MMRLFLIILISGTIKCFSQTKEATLQGDSLFIRAENIATDPFNFGPDPLTHLCTRIKFAKPTIKVYPVANRHVDNVIDTTYGVSFGQDSFSLYKWSKEENALLNADVATERFVTRHGIRVGMTKAQIKNILKAYNVGPIPKYLFLENTEIIEFLVMEFNGEILMKVHFEGYFD